VPGHLKQAPSEDLTGPGWYPRRHCGFVVRAQDGRFGVFSIGRRSGWTSEVCVSSLNLYIIDSCINDVLCEA
jgi:hypothetical protein